MQKKRLLVIAFLFLFIFAGNIIASTESDFLKLVNTERLSAGKPLLYLNSNLTQAAYLHSKDMGDNSYFSHNSLDGKTFDKRIMNAGYSGYYLLGENIAYHSGSEDALYVFSMWKNSPGHYANMMGDYNEMGLGVYSINGLTYYTQDLGKRPDSMINKNSSTLNQTSSTIPKNISTNSTVPKTNTTIPINSTIPSTNTTLSNSTIPKTNSSVSNWSNSSTVENKTNNTIISPIPVINITKLNLSVTLSKTLTNYYKNYKIYINTNRNSLISYKLNRRLYTICSSCSKVILSLRIPVSSSYNLDIFAKDNSYTVNRSLVL